MTIQAINTPIQYVGTSATAVYAVPWRFLANNDLLVFYQANATATPSLLALTTDFTLTGAGSYSGGALTLVAGNLATGAILTIFLSPVQENAVATPDGGPFFGSVIEQEVDRLTQIVQALQVQVNHCIQTQIADATTAAHLTLPLPAARASKALKFDSNGYVVAV